MDAEIAKLLDGELSDVESPRFRARMEEDPSFGARVLEYQRLLRDASALRGLDPQVELRSRVMARLRRRETPRDRSTRPGRRRTVQALTLAASLAAVFVAGRWSSGPSPVVEAPLGPPTRADRVRPLAWISDAAESGRAVAVRFVHRPLESDVSSVHVTGSFNRWEGEGIPMRFDGEVWSVTLVVPVGSYEYSFVENGGRWLPDPAAPRFREDGFGGRNAVLDADA